MISISNRALANLEFYLQPGHNGPYNDPETLVRNYGHWLITFSKCFEMTGEQIYLNKIKEFAEYLISDNARPFGYSFHHRSKESKDKCNGLIGQAWTFEALARASSVLDNEDYAQAAEDVFFQHKYNVKIGLWNRLEIDGRILSIDDTFNHQLWFAACASLLNTPRREEIRERILRFMDCLPQNLSVLENGLIYHPIERQLNRTGLDRSIKFRLKKFVKTFLSFLRAIDKKTNNFDQIYREKMINKSIGYHQFNMYAFAMLKESLPGHLFWQSFEFERSRKFLLSDEFKNCLSDNIYGYPYNPPGFEVPFALSAFSDLTENELVGTSSWWVNEQIGRCYNPETQMMDRNTQDPLTQTARIYELTRLPTSILNRIEVAI
tara:strand:+ start:71 stop:1204 length:1134 start_codon:yes stop_codon:yes gene_type:complete